MENSPDVEDIIPPTPNVQSNKLCARVGKASVTSSKLSRKVLKNGANGYKRKRMPNSPDYKKVKQKVKQVTLLNFLVKTNKVDEVIPLSNAKITSPVKVNLLNKFKETEKKNIPEMVSQDIDEGACKSESPISSHDNQFVKEVCEEVASLKLNSESKNLSNTLTISEKLNRLSSSCDMNFEKHVLQVGVEDKAPSSMLKVNENLNKLSNSYDRNFNNDGEKHHLQKESENKDISSTLIINENINQLSSACDANTNNGNEKNDLEVEVGCKDLPSTLTVNKNLTELSKSCEMKLNTGGGKHGLQAEANTLTINGNHNKSSNSCDMNFNNDAKKHNLELEAEDKDSISSNLTINEIRNKLTNSCDMNMNNAGEKHDLQMKDSGQKASKDMDQTFSWMTDELWENEKENFNLSNDFSHEMAVGCNDMLPEENNCLKFQVKEFQKDHERNEICLVVVPKNDFNSARKYFLKGFWADSIINVGDTVHILNPAYSKKNVIDNQTGFLVVNPDFLISSTAVVSTLFCMRKAVLNHILPQWSSGNDIMMIGSLVHDIFQKSVNNHLRTPAEILSIVKSVMKKREALIALCCQDSAASEIEEKVCKYIPNIIDWINKHCSFEGKNTLSDLSITNVEDIEENMWCPKYGIKGKIDMTVKAYSPKQVASKIMPLELKTGRPTYSAEHMGQVNLYSLMMEERSNETPDGLLLYLRDKAEMKVISTNHNSKRGLIQLRNELASYVYKWVSSNNCAYNDIEQCVLPKPINNKRNCEKCPYLLPCTVYQKIFSDEKQYEPSHAMKSLIPLSTKHLSDSHINYFLHWSRLLLLENVTTAEVKAFWTEDAAIREKQGMCLSHMFLDENVSVRQEADEGYFIHTFRRCEGNPVSPDLKSCHLKEGDYVAISIQENLHGVAVSMGYIISVKEHFIELVTERNLRTLDRLKGVIFRIDKIVSSSAASCVRNNLMLLMQAEDQASKLRKFIIDKQTPKYAQSLSKQIVLLGRAILKCLNKDQQKAVLKALMAEDYFLIKGMPGTGKTSTIVALVRLLLKLNMSVLLTSYTHSAIDNILLKLKEHTDFVRLGPKYRIHPEILKYSFENLTKDFVSVEEFSRFMKEKMVVATTSLGVNHAIFKLRKFDVCIVDEASQINQIACLGPLFYAKRFILVGDDKQLPPLVLNFEARERGMQESLFQRLQKPETCMELTLQYRMNREIMRLCNELTYNGSLRCGSEEVANAVLHLNKMSDTINNSSLLWSALDNDISKSVCFINTENYQNDHSDKNKNEIEAELVINILQLLTKHKVLHSEIGIIAPYRKQVELIEFKLKELNMFGIEINTVDQYQGRDKDVIIVSCARPSSSPVMSEKAGGILDDARRLNVAISRARKKLILIGSKPALSSYIPFKNLLECLREDQFLDIT